MDIRVVDFDGEPWFVAKDVCRAIGYGVKRNGEVNVSHALRTLDAAEMTTHRMSSKQGNPPKAVSESGLYKLIMRSDKPQARTFQDWVTKVVLPTIRKTGSYSVSGGSVTGTRSVELRRSSLLAKLTDEQIEQTCRCLHVPCLCLESLTRWRKARAGLSVVSEAEKRTERLRVTLVEVFGAALEKDRHDSRCDEDVIIGQMNIDSTSADGLVEMVELGLWAPAFELANGANLDRLLWGVDVHGDECLSIVVYGGTCLLPSDG